LEKFPTIFTNNRFCCGFFSRTSLT